MLNPMPSDIYWVVTGVFTGESPLLLFISSSLMASHSTHAQSSTFRKTVVNASFSANGFIWINTEPSKMHLQIYQANILQ